VQGLEQFLEKKRELLKKYSKVEAMNIFPVGDITLENFKNKQNDLINEHFFVSFTGQIKAGKSTLINALVFQDNILPADDLPETAKITIINYSEEKYFEVEFYNDYEWEKLRNEELIVDGEKTNFFEKYLREDIKASGIRYGEVINKPAFKESDITKLREYVGKDGKFKPFVKLVKVYYPNNILKGITFVDTPGVNDPNPIRSKVTKDWIYKADANIFVTYAKQAMSEQDFSFIDEYLFSINSTKKITVVNKIDTVEDTLEDLKKYIIDLVNNEDTKRRNIFGDEESIVYTSALGGLIDSIEQSKGEIPDEFREYAERLEGDDIDFLKDVNHNIPQLKTVIESKLIENKGKGLIESKSAFLNSLFEKKLRIFEIEKSGIIQRLGLYEKSEEELKVESVRLKRARGDILNLFKISETTLTKSKNNAYRAFSLEINKVRKEIVKDCVDKFSNHTNTKHFEKHVQYDVKEAIENKYPRLSEVADEVVKELEQHIEDNMRILEQDLKDFNVMDFSLQSQLIHLCLVDIVHEMDGIKKEVTSKMSGEIIAKLVDENANWIQRFFDTKGGLDNIKNALESKIKNFLESALDGSFSNIIKNGVSQAIKEILSELQQTTNKIIEDQQSEISKVQNNLFDNAKSIIDYKEDIMALDKAILDMHDCKRDII